MSRRMDLTKVREKAKRLGKAVFFDTLKMRPEGVGRIMLQTGYAPSTVKATAQDVIAQPIVQAAMIDTEITVKGGLARLGVGGEFLAKNIKELIQDKNYKAKSAGLDFALKTGVGGGYAPVKTSSVSVEVTGNVKEFGKFKELSDEYDKRLAAMEMEDGANLNKDID